MEMEQQILDRLERMEDKIERILIQTTKTNGRVGSLENRVDNHSKRLSGLIDTDNKTKGRDKMIWIFLSAVGAVALVLIGKFIK
jgi:hypothetical protein